MLVSVEKLKESSQDTVEHWAALTLPWPKRTRLWSHTSESPAVSPQKQSGTDTFVLPSIKSRWKKKKEMAKEQNSSWTINQWTRWIFFNPHPPTPNLLCLPTKQFLVSKWKVANIMYIIQNDHYSAGVFFPPLLFWCLFSMVLWFINMSSLCI